MSRFKALKRLPWPVLVRGGAVAGRRWRALAEKDRRRILELARRSRGLPRNLTSRERTELRKLLAKIDARAAARELLMVTGKKKWRKRR